MAVIRDTETVDNTVGYIATLAFFCGVSCITLMLKFGGFKASLNFYNGKKRRSYKDEGEIGSAVSITGAYRTNRDEFFAYPETQRKITPSVVPVKSTERLAAQLRQVKSTSDLIKDKNISPNLLQDNPGMSQDPRGAEQNETRNNNNQENNKPKEKKLDAQKRVEKQKLEGQKKLEKQRLEEQKKSEKQRLEEQKKQEKQALQEQAKQEKLRKEREKKEAQLAKKDKKKKKAAPQRPVANPLAQANTSTSNNPLAQGQVQNTTNTLESSISKTSGPPPYSEIPKPEGENDSSGNVTYSKPIDTGSWDMVSKHRENINRPINTAPTKQSKQMMMDLKFKLEEGNKNKDNSDA